MIVQKGWLFSKDIDTKRNVPFFLKVRDVDIVSSSIVPSSVLLKTDSNFGITLFSDTQDCTTYFVNSNMSNNDYMYIKLYKNGLFEIDSMIDTKPTTAVDSFDISLPFGLNTNSNIKSINAESIIYPATLKVLNVTNIYPLYVMNKTPDVITDTLSEDYNKSSFYKLSVITNYFGSSTNTYIDEAKCREDCYKLLKLNLLTESQIGTLDTAEKSALVSLLSNVFSDSVIINLKMYGTYEI